jgi:hypothetical protein
VLGVLAVRRVDERVEVAELELQDAAHAMAPSVLTHRRNDLTAVLDLALVIVSEVEDEQVPKVKLVFHRCRS